MVRKIANVLSASLLAAVLVGAQAEAQAPGFYNGFTSLPTIPYANGPMSSGPVDNPASVFLQLRGGSPTAFTMDTGSTGVIASSKYFKPGPNDIAQGPGTVTYTSSNNVYKGTYYLTDVAILQNGNSGSQVATSRVTVLAADQSCPDNKACTSNFDFAYAGVGYNRPAQTVAPPTGSNINPFTNITSLASGAPLSTYRQGYIVTNSGVTLGLSSATTQGFGIIKLLPDTAKATPTGTPWNTAPMTVLVNNGNTPNAGTLLPDTGITYMFLSTTTGNQPATTPCSTSPPQRNCAVTGTQFQVWLPGQTGAAASFSYVVPTATEGQPGRVDWSDATPFINTGRQFYENFTYFYDDVGGFVGYIGVPGGSWAAASVALVLSLNGTVPLPANFLDTMPVFLAGSTVLQTGGAAAFNAPITGGGNSLTLTGGGAFAFNAPVGLGGGAFSLQQGAAAINAGLSAASVSVSAQGALTNNLGSTITGSVSNAGAFNNSTAATVSGAVTNTGAFNNSGVVIGAFTNSGLLSGNGIMVGNVVNTGVVAPGNSIGTLNIAGNYAQPNGGAYQAEVNSAGQSDLLNISGTAALQGGTVNVVAQQGSTFGARTTYKILTAFGGINGAYASVNELYPFLLSSLSYDANNVYLTLAPGGFAAAAQTNTQYAVGRVLDANVGSATGDFATIIGTLAVLPSSQVLPFMTSISGQNYSSFSSTMVQGAALFMNNFANQTGGGGSPASNRVALAEACEVACDAGSPALWGAWGSALGGLGTIGANAATGGVTYNAGGFAAGLDRLMAPGLRLGVTTGYTTGTQWTSGFSGNGTTDTFLAGLYGNYRMDKIYADAVLGYAYSYNQMWRQISIPNLQQRLAQGRAGSNQFYGQVEGGYRFDIGPVGTAAADAYITPFARLQGYTGSQNGFTETGAQSLNLTVAGQTTNSLRSVIGAQLGGAIDLGWREKLALQFRLGWSHEYASTARPVTATLAGAPLMPFTTYGIAPQRDGVVVGFSANTAIAETTSLYLRYEGNVSGQDSAHALTAGVRMTW